MNLQDIGTFIEKIGDNLRVGRSNWVQSLNLYGVHVNDAIRRRKLDYLQLVFCGSRHSMLILARAIQCLLPPLGTELKSPTRSIYHFDLHSPHTGTLVDSGKILQKYGESKVIRVAWHVLIQI
jgi:hypothetical protein